MKSLTCIFKYIYRFFEGQIIEHNRVHINCMLFASEENLSQTFLQICPGTVLETEVGELSCQEMY